MNKVTYTDDVTVIEAQNLNDIQDEIISLETVDLVAVNSDLDTIQTPGRYRLWGAYTNAPKTGNVYGILTVDGVSGALIQTYQSATSTDSYFRGYTNSQWYPWRQFMLNSGGTFTGNITVDRNDGTASAQGYSTIFIGNNIPTGTANNSMGQICLYSANSTYYANLHTAGSLTANRQFSLPDASGTIALDNVTTGTITAASGWTIAYSRLAKYGHVVTVTFNISGGALSTTGWNIVGTIPSGFRPPYAIDFCGIDNVNCNSFQAQIAGGGNINIYKSGGQTINNNVRLHVTYIVD